MRRRESERKREKAEERERKRGRDLMVESEGLAGDLAPPVVGRVEGRPSTAAHGACVS